VKVCVLVQLLLLSIVAGAQEVAVPQVINGKPLVCLDVSFANSVATKIVQFDTLKLQLKDTEGLLDGYKLQLSSYAALDIEQKQMVLTQADRINQLVEEVATLNAAKEDPWKVHTLFTVGGITVGVGVTLLTLYLVQGSL
jgi:hypothetical protein